MSTIGATSAILKKGLKGLGTPGGIGFAIDTGMNLAGGDNIGTAAAKASVTGALFASNPVVMSVLTGASMLGEGMWAVQDFKFKKQKEWSARYARSNEVGGFYQDTMRAQTMRQAAVMAIQGSKLNARSALGSEAKLLNPYEQRR